MNQFVECDANDNVIVSTNCDDTCRTCADRRVLEVPFDQCVSMSSDGRSFYNQGVSPCESVVITQYNLSDCAGKAVGRFAMGQYECSNDLYVTCSRNPLLPVPDGSHVTVSTCPWNSNCVNCTDKVVESGQCFDSPFASGSQIMSRTVKCNMEMSWCADLAMYHSSDCRGSAGYFAPVCGECSRFGNETTYSHILCDSTTLNISMKRGCNSDCTKCNDAVVETHGYHACAPGVRSGTFIFNRGLFPCSTVTVRDLRKW